MRPLQKFLSLGLTILLASSFCGCLKSVPLGQRGIVLALGIDKSGGYYHAAMQIDAEGPKPEVVQAKARTLTELFTEASVAHGRQLVLGSLQLIVVGEETAREGLGELFSFLNAYYQLDPMLQFAVVQGEAKPLIAGGEEDPALASEPLRATLENAWKAGWSPRSRLMDVMGAMLEENQTACAALITLRDPEETVITAEEDPFQTLPVQGGAQSEEDSPDATEPSSGKEDKKNPLVASPGGTGLFRGDQLEELLDARLTRGLQWLQNEIVATPISVEDGRSGSVSAVSYGGKSKVEIRLGDNPIFDFQVNVSSRIQESNLLGSLPDEAYIAGLQEQLLQKEIEDALAASQRAGYDPLRLSLLMRQKYPEYYNENRDHWEDVMQASGYPVELICKVDRSGQ